MKQTSGVQTGLKYHQGPFSHDTAQITAEEFNVMKSRALPICRDLAVLDFQKSFASNKINSHEIVFLILLPTVVMPVSLFFQLRNLAYEDLEMRLSDLDPEMEREIDELRARYQAKRQPILEAIDAKKKRQQNF